MEECLRWPEGRKRCEEDFQKWTRVKQHADWRTCVAALGVRERGSGQLCRQRPLGPGVFMISDHVTRLED